MIVRAQTPLMRGAQLTPVRRNYTGPRRGLSLVPPRVGYRRVRGVGDFSLGPYDVVGLMKQDSLSYMNPLGSTVENGTAVSPATFQANLLGEAQSMCSGRSWGQPMDRCTVPTDLITQLAADYAAKLAQEQARVAAGGIALPSSGQFANMPTGYYAAPAPITMLSTPQVVLPPAPSSGALELLAAQNAAARAAQSNAPAPAPIPAPAPAAVSQSNATNSTVVIPGVSTAFGWLTESMFGGIPNWVMVAGAAGVGVWALSNRRR